MFFENMENNININALKNKIIDVIVFSEKFKLNIEKSNLFIRNNTLETIVKFNIKKQLDMFLICIGFFIKKARLKIIAKIKGKNIDAFNIIFFMCSNNSSILFFSKKRNKNC